MGRGLASLVMIAAVSACVGTGSSPSAGGSSDDASPNAPSDVTVPAVIGAEQAEARRELEALGLKALVMGSGGPAGAGVLEQSPPAGWRSRQGEIVRLRLTLDGRSLAAAEVRAAIDASADVVGPGFFVLAVKPAGASEMKRSSCGDASCAGVRLSDGQRGATAGVQLHPTVAVFGVGRQTQPDAPPRLMSYEEIVSAATSVPAVQARLGGRPFSTAVAGGGDEAWCVGQPSFPGNFCDTVIFHIAGEPGDPLLATVNWITGVAGLSRWSG
jgi:hypothetical protein